MESYYYNSSTIMKYLRKVLNEIHGDYVDSGIRAGFIMKRYGEKYHFNNETLAKLVLLCMLKDIGCYYQDGVIDSNDYALASASSYCFLKHCSPLKDAAKPLLFYNAQYIENIDDDDYYCGLLITLINLCVRYVYEEYTLEEIEKKLKSDTSGRLNPDQVRKLIKLLKEDSDILEKLNQKNSLFVHEACAFVQHANYTEEELLRYIDMTNFSFEFHNHETLAHTVTTAAIAKELSILSRLTENQINCIYLASLVHDIGKIRVPVEILCHPGRLEGEELKEMRRHVEYTREILEGSFSYKIIDIASNHHERLDGSGYPRGLRAIDLSIGDKIIAVADLASALYCKRSYKKSFSKEEIIAIMESDSENGKIDTRITNHFINNFDKIMALAKSEENRVLEEYNAMMEEFNVLSQSEQLRKFYVSQNEEKAPVIEEPEQKVIYVDDDGNIIEDIDNYMEKSFNNETDEIDEMLNQIPEKKIEETDEIDEMLNQIPEKKTKETDEIDEMLNQIPEKKTKETDEIDEMLNQIPEKKIEKPDEIDEMLNQIPKIKFEDEDLDNDQDLDFLNDEDEE